MRSVSVFMWLSGSLPLSFITLMLQHITATAATAAAATVQLLSYDTPRAVAKAITAITPEFTTATNGYEHRPVKSLKIFLSL